MYKSLYKAHINVPYLRLLCLLTRSSLGALDESSQSGGEEPPNQHLEMSSSRHPLLQRKIFSFLIEVALTGHILYIAFITHLKRKVMP